MKDQVRVILKREMQSKYRRSRLGASWIFVGPLLTTAVMVLAFAGIFKIPLKELPSYTHYVLSGVVFTTFISSGLTSITTAISFNREVLSKVKVWKFAYPTAVLIAQIINFLFGLIFAFIAGIIAGQNPNMVLVFAVISISSFIFGLGLMLSVVQVRFEDLGNILPIILQLLMYVTPVFYKEELVPIRYKWVLNGNPFVHFLRIFRFGVGSTNELSIASLVGSQILSSVVLIFGMMIFVKNWKKSVSYL